MKISDNTILVTGGGSGIGRALAEALQKEGNQVIIAGRRTSVLEEVTTANPGMRSMAHDIDRSDAIREFAERVSKEFPRLNVLINNSGIMRPENVKSSQVTDAEAMITTNLLGPIRLTAALLPQLQRQSKSTIMMVSSGLAFLPLTMTPTYCATKAAVHSYTQSLRWQLRDTSTEVVELIPPYVQTHLMGEHQAADSRAMPLDEFIAEVMQIIRTQPNATEINVERVKPLRFAAESGKYDQIFKTLNESMPAPH